MSAYIPSETTGIITYQCIISMNVCSGCHQICIQSFHGRRNVIPISHGICHWPLTRYAKLWVAHAPGMPGTFSPPSLVIDPDMHHGTCLTHVPWCMSGSLTCGFLWNRWRGKRSRHSRRMRNPKFCVSGKRPIGMRISMALLYCCLMHKDMIYQINICMVFMFQLQFWAHFARLYTWVPRQMEL